jgi:hypothetical protein
MEFLNFSSFVWSTSLAAPDPLKIEVHMEFRDNYPQFPLHTPNHYFSFSRASFLPLHTHKPPPVLRPSVGDRRPLPPHRASPPITALYFLLHPQPGSRWSFHHASPPCSSIPNHNPRGQGEERRLPGDVKRPLTFVFCNVNSLHLII